jgi:hypothetical protein
MGTLRTRPTSTKKTCATLCKLFTKSRWKLGSPSVQQLPHSNHTSAVAVLALATFWEPRVGAVAATATRRAFFALLSVNARCISCGAIGVLMPLKNETDAPCRTCRDLFSVFRALIHYHVITPVWTWTIR